MGLLKDRVAVVYGAGGAIGSAVANAFAAQGALVVLVGRSKESLGTIQRMIGSRGYVSVADAQDSNQVTAHLEQVNRDFGSIDISFNAIGLNDLHGVPLLEIKTADFLIPITIAMESHLITATASARHMRTQGRGVLLGMTANASSGKSANVGGFGVACSALESLYRQLATELGPYGIRTALIRSAGSPDAPGLAEVFREHGASKGQSAAEFEKKIASTFPLRRFPTLREIGSVAVLLASDLASPVTGAIFNATCGDILDS
jgi:3-oxoacyl-[acyl-carrier protein] reductase